MDVHSTINNYVISLILPFVINYYKSVDLIKLSTNIQPMRKRCIYYLELFNRLFMLTEH